MKAVIWISIILLLVGVAQASVFLDDLRLVDIPTSPGWLYQTHGDFVGVEFVNSGQAVVQVSDELTFLELREYRGQAGDSIHVVLSNDLIGSAQVDLGTAVPLASSTFYRVPDFVSFGKYRYVLIWSTDNSKILGYADLGQK